MAVFDQAKAFRTLRQTPAILGALIKDLSQAQAQQARDGADGWNVIEIICHLRDFETIFHDRARGMVETDHPHFPRVDHLELAVKHRYAEQDLRAVLADYAQRRQAFMDWLSALSDEQWTRRGVHPEYGEYSVLELAYNTALHDVNHIEQVVKALKH
jgi:hypothetical protein